MKTYLSLKDEADYQKTVAPKNIHPNEYLHKKNLP
jgi:hypothetical protein